jgi:hypothetical protein
VIGFWGLLPEAPDFYNKKKKNEAILARNESGPER